MEQNTCHLINHLHANNVSTKYLSDFQKRIIERKIEKVTERLNKMNGDPNKKNVEQNTPYSVTPKMCAPVLMTMRDQRERENTRKS